MTSWLPTWTRALQRIRGNYWSLCFALPLSAPGLWLRRRKRIYRCEKQEEAKTKWEKSLWWLRGPRYETCKCNSPGSNPAGDRYCLSTCLSPHMSSSGHSDPKLPQVNKVQGATLAICVPSGKRLILVWFVCLKASEMPKLCTPNYTIIRKDFAALKSYHCDSHFILVDWCCTLCHKANFFIYFFAVVCIDNPAASLHIKKVLKPLATV